MNMENPCSVHDLTDDKIVQIRTDLLKWFAKHKREMAWRSAAANPELDCNVKAYQVLVSEIMLQQTQVAVKWPTIQKLAEANIEDINEVWAGLGYYARARNMHKAALQVCSSEDKKIPQDIEDLMKLAGVGRYTASAVASIVFNKKVGVVDGNVQRVLSRMCRVGNVLTDKNVTKFMWNTADHLVPEDSPGDFNQAVMELGAIVSANSTLTLIRKNFGEKPVSKDSKPCDLCFQEDQCYDNSLGVCNYPRKIKRNASKKQTLTSVVFLKDSRVLVVKREKGLLSGLWELPTFAKLVFEDVKEIGKVSHKFSHIDMTYSAVLAHKCDDVVENGLNDTFPHQKWIKIAEFTSVVTSTAMRKVWALVKQSGHLGDKCSDKASTKSQNTRKRKLTN